MYELYPYFTNDGSVGLFSPSEDDIYHSTYGALTESWEKFIIPSRLEHYINTHDNVKVLDLCYGIGYNTKTALQVFINSCLKNENNNKSSKINLQNTQLDTNSIASIDADNICGKNPDHKILDLSKNKDNDALSNEAIHTDNLFCKCLDGLIDAEDKTNEKLRRNIIIDAVDVDKILINLSPFITKGITNNKIFEKYLLNKYFGNDTNASAKSKISQVKKMKKLKIVPPPNKFKIIDEVAIILFLKLIKNNSGILNEPILQMILSQKKYSPFFSKYMVNFARFCSNHGYNYVKNLNNSSFLHNIYYRYVSPSYKNAIELLKKYKFSINFHQKDARRYILSCEQRYNFIFLDAFTPAKCPALWSLDFFKELYKRLEDDGVLMTYSNSAAVRNALLKNGFCVGKIYDSNIKRFVGTIAAKNGHLIDHALDEKDISLINSKAGICYRDQYLELDNKTIILNREIEVENSPLDSSSHVLKGFNNAEAKSI